MRNGTKIEIFTEGDEKEIIRLLSEADLPTEDLTLDKPKNFLVARGKGGSVIGTIGVEPYQDIGLLRSLVVDPSHRGKGLGKQLVDELPSFGKRKGIKALFLLTIGAAGFFKRLGYEVTQRSLVPAPIAVTEEFKNIAPVSAICLFKNLESS